MSFSFIWKKSWCCVKRNHRRI